MSLWRLEWLRLVRTRRVLALVAPFVLFGFLGPVLAAYSEELLARASTGNLTITVADPVAADGIGGYVANAMQVGLLVTVVVAAAALALDSRTGLAVFYRTRVRRAAALVVPRAAVVGVAAAVAFLLGTLAAWYETVVLIEVPPAGRVLLGAAYGAVYLIFVVAVVAVAAATVRGTVATVGVAVAALLGLPVLGALPGVGRWVPSALIGAPEALLRGAPLDEHLPALAVTVAAVPLLLALAVRLAGRREL